MPSLSIITSNLNNAAGLSITLQSIVVQTFKDYELIVIDGSSKDNSMEVISRFKQLITKFVSEPDTGVYNAQNKGISLSEGEYCLFLNSGDCLANEEVLSKLFDANRNADIFYGDLLLRKDFGSPEYRKSPERISKLKMLKDTLWHPVSFIRRKLFYKFGMYDERFKIVADYEFFLRVIIKKKVKTQYIPIAVSVFDMTGMSSIPENKKRLEKERRDVQDIYFNKVILFFFRLYSELRN